MSTRTRSDESPAIAHLRALLARPSEVKVDGALTYRLGTPTGDRLGPESGRSLDPCALALRRFREGVDPDGLVLWARLESGVDYRVAAGVDLIGIAESAAGVPVRLRTPRE